jgi:hypothetical protein
MVYSRVGDKNQVDLFQIGRFDGRLCEVGIYENMKAGAVDNLISGDPEKT